MGLSDCRSHYDDISNVTAIDGRTDASKNVFSHVPMIMKLDMDLEEVKEKSKNLKGFFSISMENCVFSYSTGIVERLE